MHVMPYHLRDSWICNELYLLYMPVSQDILHHNPRLTRPSGIGLSLTGKTARNMSVVNILLSIEN